MYDGLRSVNGSFAALRLARYNLPEISEPFEKLKRLVYKGKDA